MSKQESAENKLKKAHIRLMKNRMTAPYIGAIMLGTSEVVDDKNIWKKNGMPTAGTDGVNKIYHRDWVEKQSISKMCGGVLHENLHVFTKQIPRHMDLAKDDPQLLNASMDYVVNDIIMQIKEKEPALVDLPEAGLWDVKFRNWSTREVYNFLKRGQNNQGEQEGKPKRTGVSVTIGGKEYKIQSHDGHDTDTMAGQTPEQIQEIIKKISDAIHQGGLLAGRMGLEIPRAIKDSMEPEVDWADETREFVSSATKGNDEYTFKKYNRRRIIDDYFYPSTESKKVGEVVVGIDTSGSIGQAQLDEFAGELMGICNLCQPERLRVIWWDAEPHGMQTFEPSEFQNIRNLLKPMGGGGTRVSCVSEYIVQNKITADCVVIFTDGYVEGDIKWKVESPTLWLVTQNESFSPPIGKVVKYRGKSE